jgi:hypothetical protein
MVAKRGRFSPRLLSLAVLAVPTLATAAPASFVKDGKAGFVVAHIEYALAPRDGKDSGACPKGMTQGMQIDESQVPPGLSAEEAQRAFIRKLIEPSRPTPCMAPETLGPDPNFRVVEVPDVPAYGIDLDGHVSTAKGKPAPGNCPHNDLVGPNGERGIDNQWYRVVGCSNSWQSTGLSNQFAIEMLTGSWGILITLEGVDDIHNDDDVEVGFFANGDPIELSPNREPLPNATYAVHPNPRYHAKTRGRIVNGVLTTDPVSVRFPMVVNSIYLERPLDEARVRMTLSEEGALEGYLAGYADVEEMYALNYSFSNGKNAAGEPADDRLIRVSSMGQAHVLGHTCNGAYYALHALADRDPDPTTGKCRSISTQYRLKAIPAFVVNAPTHSLNEDLAKK